MSHNESVHSNLMGRQLYVGVKKGLKEVREVTSYNLEIDILGR